jgi:hypothetical protein
MSDAIADKNWDIRAKGRAWLGDEAMSRYFMIERKIELVDGKLFDYATDRETLLCLLLENVGADRAVQLGNPQVWRDAVAKLTG